MPNPVVHFEIMAKDGARAETFYSELFGWKIDSNNPMNYGIVDNAGEGINGGVGSTPDGQAFVTFYVQVDDLQAYLDKAVKLGGKVLGARHGDPQHGDLGAVRGPRRKPDRSR